MSEGHIVVPGMSTKSLSRNCNFFGYLMLLLSGCNASRHRSRIFVEVLIKQTKRSTVNTKFCEFDGRDGEGGVYLNLKEWLCTVCM